MTITSTTARNDYTGVGSVGPYTFTFKIFAYTHLIAYVTDLSGNVTTLNYLTGFTATGANNAAGGTITLLTALTTGYALSIQRNVPVEQLTDLRNQSEFFPASYEDALDYGVMISQEQIAQLARCLQLPAASAISPTINLASFLAGYYLRVNLAGNGVEGVTNLVPDPGFLQSGAGAVQRTANAKMGEIVSVKDFGATGNGVTDDSANIQKAITYISTFAQGGAVIFPPGAYNIGTAGFALPATGDVIGLGQVNLTYSGTGNAIDGYTNAFSGTLRNFSLRCTNDAANAIRIGNGSRGARIEKVTVQASGNNTATGAGLLCDAGPAFSDALTLVEFYSLQFKYGIQVKGVSNTTDTWTFIRGEMVSLVGLSGSIIAGSIGVWTDVNSNCEGSRLSGVVIESFVKPIQFDNGSPNFGFSIEGGIEGNSVSLPTFSEGFAGEYDDPHSSFYYRATRNALANRWHREQISSGLWTTESYFDRIHVLYNLSAIEVPWGVRRGGSAIAGEAVEDIFVAWCYGQQGDTNPGRNYLKFLTYKIAWSTAVPNTGSWSVGSVVWNSAPAGGQPNGWRCTVAGTFKTLVGITGTILINTVLLTVSSVSSMVVDDFITIVGVTGTKRIVSIAGNVVTIDTNADAGVAGAAVAYAAPTFVSMGNL